MAGVRDRVHLGWVFYLGAVEAIFEKFSLVGRVLVFLHELQERQFLVIDSELLLHVVELRLEPSQVLDFFHLFLELFGVDHEKLKLFEAELFQPLSEFVDVEHLLLFLDLVLQLVFALGDLGP